MLKSKSNRYCLALILLSLFLTLLTYSRLPDPMPIHWNIQGEVDGYGRKAFAAFMPLSVMIFVWLSMNYLPKIDPKKENYQKFMSSYQVIIALMISFFFGLHLVTLAAGLGYPLAIDKIITFMLGILFMVLGNYLPKAKPNYFYGIRTPWTLASEESWRKTHRLSGKLFSISGLIILLTSFFLAGQVKFILLLLLISVSSLVPLVASYFYFSR